MGHKRKLNHYTQLINILGTGIIVAGIVAQWKSGNWKEFLFFVILSVVAESLIVPLGKNSYVSIGFAIGLATIWIFGPWVAALILALGTVLKVYKDDGKLCHIGNSSIYKRYFNGAAYAISALMGGLAYQMGAEVFPMPQFLGLSILGILLTFFGYVFANLILYSKLFSLLEQKSFQSAIFEQIWCMKNFCIIAPLSMLLLFSYYKYGWFFAALFFGPLLLARYSFLLYMDMKKMYFETITTLSNALDAKDGYTNGHSHRVAKYSVCIAQAMKMSPKIIERTQTAALLHDIGKIGIRDEVLNKEGKLNFKELYEIQQHPEIGANIIKDIRALRQVAKIVRHHHERFDGNGYPDSISGEDIPIESAIISVADAFDAMTSDRAYRRAMNKAAATEIIKNSSGTQFHPEVVEAFLSLNLSVCGEQDDAS